MKLKITQEYSSAFESIRFFVYKDDWVMKTFETSGEAVNYYESLKKSYLKFKEFKPRVIVEEELNDER